MAHDVFISYSSRDKPAADAICAKLESRGVRCWIAPRDIQPGMSWGAAIIEAIDHAHVMLLVFSSHANNSPQIKREVERSVSKEQIIIPVRVDEVKPTGDFEYFLGTPHWLDAITPPFEQHLEKIADSAKFWLERIESDAGASPPQPHRESMPPTPFANAASSPTPAQSSFERVAAPSSTPAGSRRLWMPGAALLLVALALAGFFGARYYAAQQVAQERAKEQAAEAQQAEADAEARKEAEEKARIAAQAEERKQSGWGLQVGDITPDLARQFHLQTNNGVVVRGVEPSSPAADAGIQPGDMILEVDHHKVPSVLAFLAEARTAKEASNQSLLLVQHDGAARDAVINGVRLSR